jgi:GH18 family chitinase
VGAKRILSIGGWDFSTNPSTYNIFREGVTAANRLTMATNIAKFINDNDLDGVNIDWEYPGVRVFIHFACSARVCVLNC